MAAAKAEELPRLVADASRNDAAVVLEAVSEIRKMLSIEKDPPIDAVIASGVVPRLVALVLSGGSVDPMAEPGKVAAVDAMGQVAFNAAWALTNICSGTSEHTTEAVDAGTIGAFLHVMREPKSIDILEQCVWGLGNIAGDSPRLRDAVIEQGGAEVISRCLAFCGGEPYAGQVFAPTISLLRNTMWTMSNLFRGKPPPNFEALYPFIPYLARFLIVDGPDKDALVDCLWALSYVTDGDSAEIERVQDAMMAAGRMTPTGPVDALTVLVRALDSADKQVLTPALRTLGNMVTGDDKVTQRVLDRGLLPAVTKLAVNSTARGIRKETMWLLSNLSAGTQEQIRAVILFDNCRLMQAICDAARTAAPDVAKEAVWVIANASNILDGASIHMLIGAGAFLGLGAGLQSPDPRIVTVASEGVINIARNLRNAVTAAGAEDIPAETMALIDSTIEGITNAVEAGAVEAGGKAEQVADALKLLGFDIGDEGEDGGEQDAEAANPAEDEEDAQSDDDVMGSAKGVAKLSLK